MLLTVGAVLLAGCGGDDPVAEQPSQADEPTPAATGGGDDTAEAEDDDGSSDSRDFAELANQGFASKARITYEVQGSDESSQTLVLSSDGEQTAWLMPEGRMIVRADGTSIFCDESAQQARCFEMAGGSQGGPMAGASPFMGLATAFQGGVEAFPGFASTGEQEIAGRTARCGTFDASQFGAGQNAGGGKATLCLDDETGVMLKYAAEELEGTAGSIEAVEVGEPRDSDFEAPAEPMRMDQGG